MENNTELVYFVTNHYKPKFERGCRYDDPILKIKLPLKITNISKKDTKWPNLKINILLTGAHGYIGTRLAQLLHKKYKIIGTDIGF